MANFKYFESQEPDEEIIIIVRRHWLTLNMPFYLGTVLGLVGLLLYFLVRYNNYFSLSDFWLSLENVIAGISLLFLITFVFTSWMLNYMDLLILTSKRIVEIEQNTLFSRKISVLDLDSIQDVSITEKGFFETIVGMGEVFIQTAGELPNFQYKHIPNPDDIQVMILKARENDTKKAQGQINPNPNTAV